MQSTNKSIPNGDYQIYCSKLLILITPIFHHLGVHDIMEISYPSYALHISAAF